MLGREGLSDSVTMSEWELDGAENCRKCFPDNTAHAKALRQESS